MAQCHQVSGQKIQLMSQLLSSIQIRELQAMVRLEEVTDRLHLLLLHHLVATWTIHHHTSVRNLTMVKLHSSMSNNNNSSHIHSSNTINSINSDSIIHNRAWLTVDSIINHVVVGSVTDTDQEVAQVDMITAAEEVVATVIIVVV